MIMYPPDGPTYITRVYSDGRRVTRRRGARYPVVPPAESDSYQPDFAFPGTPEQIEKQSALYFAIKNLPCGHCRFCLDCLRLERQYPR